MWRRRFAADPTVVGKTVRIGSQPFEIVGVAPATFAGLQSTGGRPSAGWVPFTTASLAAKAAPATADPARPARGDGRRQAGRGSHCDDGRGGVRGNQRRARRDRIQRMRFEPETARAKSYRDGGLQDLLPKPLDQCRGFASTTCSSA